MKLTNIIAFVVNPLRDVPVDKQGHFIIGLIAYMAFHFVEIAVGFGVVAVLAIGKEVYDWFHRDRHTPDLWDAIATMAGGIAGWICGL
jgi:hypothetical protein